MCNTMSSHLTIMSCFTPCDGHLTRPPQDGAEEATAKTEEKKADGEQVCFGEGEGREGRGGEGGREERR